MGGLKSQLLYGGLAALVAADMALTNVRIQGQSSAQYSASYGMQSRVQRNYEVQFVEREGLFSRVNGALRTIGESEWAKASKPEDMHLSGGADLIRRRYNELQQQGRIPDLKYLDNALDDIANNMIDNRGYLAGNRDFNIEVLESDRQNKIILGISRNISINGADYRVLINASGSYDGETIKIANLFLCKIGSKDDLELRQIASNGDISYFFESLPDNLVRRRKAEFYGKGLNELGFNNWSKMQEGILNQHLSKSDLRPAPAPLQ